MVMMNGVVHAAEGGGSDGGGDPNMGVVKRNSLFQGLLVVFALKPERERERGDCYSLINRNDAAHCSIHL